MVDPVRKLGKYRILSKIGQGGMGSVYLAEQEGLGRQVALKALKERNLQRRPDLLRRFEREVSVCARLSHPNIVKIFDFGFDQGVYYYVMELLQASNLEELLRKTPVQPVDFTLRVARDVTDAFLHYHPQGIVHRDIKPANIMIGPQGNAILTDFGLVKDLDASDITQACAAVGTPLYMPPEAARGQPPSAGGDIFQLGIVLYRMLTGKLPFQGRSLEEVLAQVLLSHPAPVCEVNPAVPAPLGTLVANCLQKDRSIRYQDARELSADLAAAARRRPVAARAKVLEESEPEAKPPPSPEELVPTQPMELPGRPLRLVMAALPVLLGLAAFALWRPDREPAGPDITSAAHRVSSRAAVVEWQSAAPYVGSVEWGGAGSPTRRVQAESSPTTSHSVRLEPLEAGARYVYQIVPASGPRGLEQRYSVPASVFRPLEARAGPRRLALRFETAHPAVATLRVGSRETTDLAPGHVHELAVEPCDPWREPLQLTFTDVLGEPVEIADGELRKSLRVELQAKLAAALAARLEGYEPARFLRERIDRQLPAGVCVDVGDMMTQTGIDGILAEDFKGRYPEYVGFAPGDRLARSLGQTLREHLESMEWMGSLRSLSLVSPGVLDGGDLPIAAELALQAGLTKLQDVDFYARLAGLDVSTGVERLLARDYVPRLEPALGPASPSIEEKIPEPRAFVCPEAEFRSYKSANMLPAADMIKLTRHEWSVHLQDPARWRLAELTLVKPRIENDLEYRVTVNGKLTLHFRLVGPESRGLHRKAFPQLAVGFDPRVLRDGVNSFEISLHQTRGARHLGLRTHSRLEAVRLAWDR